MTNRKLEISDPCKALATELETGQSIMAPWAKVVQFNCNDEADAKICASQGIVSYPTVRIARSARQFRYRGAFTATGIATMVAEISLPLVSKADRALLSAMKPLDIPILLVTFEEGSSGTDWNILDEVARQFRGRYFVLATSEPELSGRMSDKSDNLPRVTVINKLDDATPVYRGSLMTEALFEFAEMSLAPLIPKLTDLSKLVQLMKPRLTPVKSGVPLGLLLTDNAAERRRLVESLVILAVRYRGRINMATVDATELPFIAAPLGVDPGRYPAFVLQSQEDACIHDQSLRITSQSIEEFILGCVGDFSGWRV